MGRKTNNRWAAVAGGCQWLVAVWCSQLAWGLSHFELLAPAVISLLSGSMTIFGFMKHEMLNEEVDEFRVAMKETR